MDLNYKADLKPANEVKVRCAFCPQLAVVAIKVDEVRRDVCQRCWKRLRER